MNEEKFSALIVDDDEAVRAVLEHHIRDLGAEIYSVANGIEALDVLEKNEIDVVITDYKMPVMNGLKLCHAIQDRNIQVATIMITAFGDYELVKAAISAGIFDFIEKPFEKALINHRVLRARDHIIAKKKEVKILNRLIEVLELKASVSFEQLNNNERIKYLEKIVSVADLKISKQKNRDRMRLN